jgi:hypothetical protein
MPAPTDIVSMLRDMRRRLDALERRSPLANSGLSVVDEGALDVHGNLDVSGHLGVSGGMDVTGDLQVTGNMDVTGSFTLPDESISDSWLANLTGWASAPQDTATGWSTSTSFASKASTSVTVPGGKGYTTALVLAFGAVTYADSAPNRFDCRAVIEGSNGASLPNLANTVGQSTVLHTRTLAVTSGQVINLSVQVLSAVGASNSANVAVCGGFALFAR